MSRQDLPSVHLQKPLVDEWSAVTKSGRAPVPDRKRCGWAAANEVAKAYHDLEWGVPQHNDLVLFEFLVLEGAQAGLSWETILRKRGNYRSAFDNFDPCAIAAYDKHRISQLMHDEGIIRNRMKIEAAIRNARLFVQLQKEFGSFDRYVWRFVDGQPRINHWRMMRQVPARTLESDLLSQDLRKRGFAFVGSTICYAFMQAIGMVNDHLVTCFRYRDLAG